MPRTGGYSQEEDKLLCQVYMDISQDPITGAYQTSDQFWSRVSEAYESTKVATWSKRSKRSMQARVQAIEKATKKLHSCIKHCDSRKASGVSNEDGFQQAKQMLLDDPNYKSGWKFDHVWNIIKNFEKFKDGNTSARKASNLSGFGNASSDSGSPIPDSTTQASSGLSPLSLNLDGDEDFSGGSPSQRPSGVKKAKLKRKMDDQTSNVINTLKEGNSELVEQLKKSSAQRQQHLEIQSKNYALKELKEENKILFKDLNSIVDSDIRAFVL